MASISPAKVPTIYFIGVTTGSSSILKIFPRWAEALGLGECAIAGVDLPPHAPAQQYREVVAAIKADPLARGALVTTHKIDLFAACRDQFDEIEDLAGVMGELSCLSKRDGKLIASAKDPITSGLALEDFLPAEHFARTGGELFSMGAGGSTIAITWYLARPERGANRPARMVVSNRSRSRLESIERIHEALKIDIPVQYVLAPGAEDNDAVVASLAPGSLVVNATGLGKDAPGSPTSDAVRFPEGGLAWDLNYRGDLVFLEQAQAQAAARSLVVADGWTYFIHGWSQVIADVFDVEIAPQGPLIERLSQIAGGPPRRKAGAA